MSGAMCLLSQYTFTAWTGKKYFKKKKSSRMLPAIYVKQPARGDSKTVKAWCNVTLYFIVLNAEVF